MCTFMQDTVSHICSLLLSAIFDLVLVKTFLHFLVVLHGGAKFPPIEGVFLNHQQSVSKDV